MVRFKFCYRQNEWRKEDKDPETDLQRVGNYSLTGLTYMIDDWEEGEKPFQDDMSRAFLGMMSEHSGHTWSMDEKDWYSILIDGERYCILEREFDVSYGLYVLRQSMFGRYTVFQSRGFYEADEFSIWDALSMMKTEVLIAVDPFEMADMQWELERKLMSDGYVLENFPVYYPYSYKGIRLSKESAIRVGKGHDQQKLNSAELLSMYHFNRDWRDHLAEICKEIREQYPDTKPLMDLPAEEMGLEAFAGKLAGSGYSPEDISACLEPEKPGRSTLRIINHMLYIPDIENNLWRRPPFARLRIRSDGSILLAEELSCKWPDYVDLLAQVFDMIDDMKGNSVSESKAQSCSYGKEPVRVIRELVVVTGSDEEVDFSNVVCGFDLKRDVIECFDGAQAARLFARELRRISDLEKLPPLPEHF